MGGGREGRVDSGVHLTISRHPYGGGQQCLAHAWPLVQVVYILRLLVLVMPDEMIASYQSREII
jgi:hypothetical protein